MRNWKLLLGSNPNNPNLSMLEKTNKLAKRMAYLRISLAKFLDLKSINWMNNQRYHIDLDNSVFYKLGTKANGEIELKTIFGVGDPKTTSNLLIETIKIYNSRNDEENAAKFRVLLKSNLDHFDINYSGVETNLYLNELKKDGIEIVSLPFKFSDNIRGQEANLSNLIPVIYKTETGLATGVITSSTGDEVLDKVVSLENKKLGINVTTFLSMNYLVTQARGSIRCLTLVDTLPDALKLVEEENLLRKIQK